MYEETNYNKRLISRLTSMWGNFESEFGKQKLRNKRNIQRIFTQIYNTCVEDYSAVTGIIRVTLYLTLINIIFYSTQYGLTFMLALDFFIE